jgi:uncharacterized UPF0160 family protein
MNNRTGKDVVTHSGYFHTDEVFAITMLKRIFNINKIYRTRDAKFITEFDGYVVDVGGVYDPVNLRFDHHQTTMNDDLYDSGVPMSSCGLIYKHYGKRLLEHHDSELSDTDIDTIHKKFYHIFVKEVDANDNGVSITTGYQHIGRAISNFNKDPANEEEQLSAFYDALKFCNGVMFREINRLIEAHKAFSVDEGVVLESMKSSPAGILVLTESCNPYPVLAKHDPNNDYKLVVMPFKEKEKTLWSVKTRQIKRFTNLVDLPSQETAENLIGKDLVFIHKKLFIGRTLTKESAIKICEKALHDSQTVEWSNVPEMIVIGGFFVFMGVLYSYCNE